MRRLVCLCILSFMTGCVAPETPPAPRKSAVKVDSPTTSTANFEDAPRPNRKIGASGNDSIIRMAR